MIDFHNHLLPGIDDGSPDFETTVRLHQGLIELGFTEFICTPHIIADTYPNTPDTIRHAAETVKQEALHTQTLINFGYAAEYMLDDTFHHALLSRQSLLTLHGNRILVEFSYIQKPSKVENFSFDIQIGGYEPVLAHPERYMYYHKQLGYYQYLKDLGFEMQLNLLSLTPYYGQEVQKVANHLLKNGFYDFACTDLHHDRHLQTLNAFFTAESLRELFEKHNLRNAELSNNSAQQ